MLKVTVYTAAGQPTFEVPFETTADQLRQIVEDRYGWNGIGVRHSFVAVRA